MNLVSFLPRQLSPSHDLGTSPRQLRWPASARFSIRVLFSEGDLDVFYAGVARIYRNVVGTCSNIQHVTTAALESNQERLNGRNTPRACLRHPSLKTLPCHVALQHPPLYHVPQ